MFAATSIRHFLSVTCLLAVGCVSLRAHAQLDDAPTRRWWRPVELPFLVLANNTGELSAMLYMIRRAATRRRGAGREVLHTDSLYALNMTTGKWMPRRKHRNTAMIELLRREWRELQRRRPGEIELAHVRSHTKVPGNEIADWLAERGSDGALRSATWAAADWADRWMRGREFTSAAGERGGAGARAGASHPAPGGLGDPRGEG